MPHAIASPAREPGRQLPLEQDDEKNDDDDENEQSTADIHLRTSMPTRYGLGQVENATRARCALSAV
jgi:hypothetical protein